MQEVALFPSSIRVKESDDDDRGEATSVETADKRAVTCGER